MHDQRVFMLRILIILVAFVPFGLAPGCSPTESPSQQEQMSDRYAHRFTPRSDEWTMESKIIPGKWEIWELSDYAKDAQPSPEQQRAADDLVERTSAVVLRNGWEDFDKAIGSGFRKTLMEDPNHYENPVYLFDDHILDPERPEFLMFYELDGVPRLAGVMFFVNDHSQRGPQIGGPLTVWHLHNWADPQCVLREVVPLGVAPDQNGHCENGVSTASTVEMLHVWLIDRPKGPFSTSMIVPDAELRAALAKRMAKQGY
jgi:hypothetical protein